VAGATPEPTSDMGKVMFRIVARATLAGALLGAACSKSRSPRTEPVAGRPSPGAHLDVAGGRRGAAVIDALVAAPGLADVRHLDLARNALGDVGVRALLATPKLPRLTTLSLADNGLGPDGAIALAADPRLASLTTLDVSQNPIGDRGVAALAASPHLKGVRILGLASVELTALGAPAVAGFAEVAELDLRDNQLGADGVAALVAAWSAQPPARLVALDLSGNRAGVAGARALAAAPLPGLRRLALSDSLLGRDGVVALTDGPLVARLTDLALDDDGLDDDAVAALAPAAAVERLALAGNAVTAGRSARLGRDPAAGPARPRPGRQSARR
jgi:Ran GTPase-activating protein (RanGAP) involved in mRNA processing and transport